MLRDEAITRIKAGCGFLSGTAQDSTIVERLKEAQRDLEKGKTLPRFLRALGTVVTVVGTQSYVLPGRFLRLTSADDYPVNFFPDASSELPTFLDQATDAEALLQASSRSDNAAPNFFVSAHLSADSSFIVLYPPPDAVYTVNFVYYRGAELLDTNVENAWLAEAPEWLIGEAGARFAMDLRDADAMGLFEKMAVKGRAACFGEIIAAEDSYGPLQMGATY